MSDLLTTRPPLWQAIARLLDEQRLTVAQLVRLSGVSRPTIYKIRDGTIPRPVTLAHLARGLATAPKNEAEVDEAYRLRAYSEMFRAAGYVPPAAVRPGRTSAQGASARLVARLRDAFGDDAQAIEGLLEAAPDLAPADRAMVLETLMWLAARLDAGQASRQRIGDRTDTSPEAP